MKQEHRFVADLYRYLAPFITDEKPFYLSLDGEAAKKGVKEGLFKDADIPDLWFTLLSEESPILIEAKILATNSSIRVNKRQLEAWRTTGKGNHKPYAWVAAKSDLNEFYYWPHNDFLKKLDDCRAKTEYPKICLPDDQLTTFKDIRMLVLHILRFAKPPSRPK